MIEFTDSERQWHSEMRSLTTDEHRREVLVGLTAEETDFYVTYLRRRNTGERDPSAANRDRFLELRQKHERARIEVIGAENQLRVTDPPRQ